MTRFVIDSGAAIHLVRGQVAVSPRHELLAPTLLRSQVLSALHAAVRRGTLTPDDARDELARIRQLKLRLLGDAVLQKAEAEYIALTRLQADAFVTLDKTLARVARAIVKTATIDELRA